jgi:hypothetical protein
VRSTIDEFHVGRCVLRRSSVPRSTVESAGRMVASSASKSADFAQEGSLPTLPGKTPLVATSPPTAATGALVQLARRSGDVVISIDDSNPESARGSSKPRATGQRFPRVLNPLVQAGGLPAVAVG